MPQKPKIKFWCFNSRSIFLTILLCSFAYAKPAFANSMEGLIVFIVPPFIVAGSVIIRILLIHIFLYDYFSAPIFGKLLFCFVWEIFQFIFSISIFSSFGPIPVKNHPVYSIIIAICWAVLFSAFSIYPNSLFFQKDTILFRRRIIFAILFGLISPAIVILLYLYLIIFYT